MVKFLYLDVGGAAIKDFSGNSGWSDLKLAIGLKPEDWDKFDDYWRVKAKDACTTLDVDTLISEIERKFEVQLGKNFSLLAVFVELFQIMPGMDYVVRDLARYIPIGLLTNMYPRMMEMVLEKGLLPSHEWAAIVDSSVVGLEKPNQKIYQLAERQAGVAGNEIIFADNTEGHLESARNRGWKTFKFEPSHPKSSCEKLNKFVREMVGR